MTEVSKETPMDEHEKLTSEDQYLDRVHLLDELATIESRYIDGKIEINDMHYEKIKALKSYEAQNIQAKIKEIVGELEKRINLLKLDQNFNMTDRREAIDNVQECINIIKQKAGI